jgi:hypothetical protein
MDNAGKIEMREPQSLGDVVWHASEEDGLPDVGYHIGLGGDASLWIGEISDTEWNEMAETEQALGSPGGWWIILHAGKAGLSPRDRYGKRPCATRNRGSRL